MITLKELDGDYNEETVLATFEGLEQLKVYLNNEGLFDWRKVNEPEYIVPTFDDCETIEQVEDILKEQSLSYWDIVVEY